ncbi:glycosyltransferase family 4 protein [Polynucleobacter necessarius]|uniref:glycosyltransferase family 4 protein n=1 Tax=Polynucleobacter necessarius TaxID=576610 RepID=UPI000E090872|nr:glycosyltransferase family 4 protein [Polynucleobacter necessarius]HAT39079.1 hypothetical protein [Polynucleobacter sp.]
MTEQFSQMKILNVIDLMNPFTGGGATTRTYQMSKFLVERGVQIEILTTNWDLDISYVAALPKVKWHSINAVHLRYLFPLGAKSWLEKNIRNYDLIHINKNWSVLSTWAALIAFKYNIPYVFSGMGLVSMSNRSQFLKLIYSKHLSKKVMKRARYCIAVTDEERQSLITAGVFEEKVIVIPNGIDFDELSCFDNNKFRRKFNLDERKIILFIGRMDEVKGVHLLIESFASIRSSLKEWQMVLIGTNTPYKNQMKKLVEEHKLSDSIYFLDPIFGETKSMAYHASEIVAIPSIKDAMTIIAPEAAYCSKPVLITNTSEFSSLSKIGGSIEVSPTVPAISEGLLKLTNDASLRLSMGIKGQEFIKKNYSWIQITDSYFDIFSASLRN